MIKAILEMGHIPVGMEMFSAADETQWKIIQRQIDESDYYVVIVANRYGSLAEEGISYTEKEYDYASSKDVPTLGFVMQSDANWPSNLTDTDAASVASLAAFKDKIKEKHISFWNSDEELYGKCAIALMKSFAAYPREGWVRGSQATDVRLTTELARLSEENSQLRISLRNLQAEEKNKQREELRKVIRILLANTSNMSFWYLGDDDWTAAKEISLANIFQGIAPELLIEKSISDMSSYAGVMFNKTDRALRDSFPVPSNQVKGWMADFTSLGLVKPSDKKKPVADKDEYWTLTEKGKRMLSQIRRAMLEEPTEPEEE